MTFGNQIPDKTLLQRIQRKMTQKGMGSNRLNATVRSGDATLTGTIKYEYERKPIVRSVAAVQGVRRVIDQLRVDNPKKTTR